jgi:thiazole/oxazole-forming peptide maturase SagD family component
VCWIPAQAALVGYRRRAGEPHVAFGVSTGTAAHTRSDEALRNALLEAIQADAAMGVWYGKRDPVALRPGASRRTGPVEEVIARHTPRGGFRPRFYWLPSPDTPGLAVACVVRCEETPASVVGLGCDLRLDRAMYHAFLESVAVSKLAKLLVLRMAATGETSLAIDPGSIYDLDGNVAYYAQGGKGEVQAKFRDEAGVDPSELPQVEDRGIAGDVRHLLDGLAKTDRQLALLDLTTTDVRELGLRVVRVWSPEMLTLSLPSAPPVMHRRFEAYGGVTNSAPHPYA